MSTPAHPPVSAPETICQTALTTLGSHGTSWPFCRAERLKAQIEVTLRFQISMRQLYASASHRMGSNIYFALNNSSQSQLPLAICSLLLFSWESSFYISPLGIVSLWKQNNPLDPKMSQWRGFPWNSQGQSDSFHLVSCSQEFVLILRRYAPQVKLFATD